MTDAAAAAAIPPVALTWILDHGAPSNVDLARWANVSRAWRNSLAQAILQQATNGNADSNNNNNHNNHNNNNNTSPLLLLPSMVSEVVRQTQQQQTIANKDNQNPPTNVTTAGKPHDNTTTATASTRRETFCAAWFAPEGVQWFDMDEHDHYERQQERKQQEQRQQQQQQQQQQQATEPFAPGGGDSYAGSEDDDANNNHNKNQKRSKNSNPKNTTNNSTIAMVDNPHRRHVHNHLKQGIVQAANRQQSSQQQQPKVIQPQRSKSPKAPNHHRPPRLEQVVVPTASWSRNTKTSNNKNNNKQVTMMAGSRMHHVNLVSPEWRGYQRAVQVLQPFGYATTFVEELLQRAEELAISNSNNAGDRQQGPPPASTPAMATAASENNSNNDDDDDDDDHHRYTKNHYRNTSQGTSYQQTTYAVRGATVARPEGYCLCWEDDDSAPVQLWTRNNTNQKDLRKEERYTIRAQERQEQQERRKEWRRQLQKVVLPRVLATKVNLSSDNSSKGSFQRHHHSQYRPRFLQFLNADGSHAVRLLTPPFACGPLVEPVTILLVGIATEDGCFLSGLRHRFELGHMYPDTDIAAVAELSPICIATDSWEAPKKNANQQQSSPSAGSHGQLQTFHSASHGSSSDDESSGDSDDSSSALVTGVRSRGLEACNCMFQNCNRQQKDDDDDNDNDESSQNSQNDNDGEDISETVREADDDDGADSPQRNHSQQDDDDEDVAERIIRGQRVPGSWHCYTAIVDGDRSVIRMDGVQELISIDQSNHHGGVLQVSSSSEAGVDIKRPNRTRRRAMLDGLTIGSDHSFDMSLCFGQGSGGEGEGAIAEIAVFHGRLDQEDLEALERRLMSKHGIPAPLREGKDLAKDDHFARQAHALYCLAPNDQNAAHIQRPPTQSTAVGTPFSFPDGIPLRFMTRHRSVAWHQFDAVTGEELKIKRIGSRSVGSSSDW